MNFKLYFSILLFLLLFSLAFGRVNAQEYTMPSFVHAIDACDMDLDGNLDIIVSCGYEDSLVILYNDGIGNFDLYYYGRTTGVALCGCVDGDSIPDIIAGKGQLYFYKGNLDRTLGSGIPIVIFSGQFTLYDLIDMDEDGWNDIFYQDYNSKWGFLKNNGNLTFEDKVIYIGHSSRPYIGDLNSDNLPDLVVSFPDPISDTKVYINNGNFNFSTFEVLDMIISDPIIMELNDSIPQDLALMETPAPDIYFYKNTGNAIFEFQGDNPLLNSHAVVINDYNDYDQDGYSDLCYSQCYITGCNDSVYVSLNTHEWSFGSAQAYYIGTLNWFRMKSADLNGDGYPDFFMTGYNSNNKIKILWNNGDGSFSYLNPVGIKDEELKEYLTFEINPNPFTSFSKIKFNCTKKSFVSLKIVDMLGLEKICLLNNQKKSAGDYVTSWDGRDASGNKCEPGAYIMILEINGNQYSKKIIHY
jgi:hypothetical protein